LGLPEDSAATPVRRTNLGVRVNVVLINVRWLDEKDEIPVCGPADDNRCCTRVRDDEQVPQSGE
jgi:hypothetical protein